MSSDGSNRFKLLIPPSTSGTYDSSALISTSALQAGVLALPGIVAFPLRRTNAYCRASFSLLSEEEMDEAARRLAGVIREANGGEATLLPNGTA